jgi:hypothetical protein
MPRYLMEVYLPCTDRDGLRTVGVRARAAAREMTGDGTAVRHVRSILVPEDRTCFLLFEAPTSRAVMETGERAALATARVTEALDDHERGDQS